MRMRQWSIVLVLGVFLSGTGVWMSVRAGLPPSPPIVPAQPTEQAPQKLPRVVADETFHNFGILEPHRTCEYTFIIRNEGEAPLVLSRGGTSCKCTMSHLPQGEVPPGSQVPVVVSSKVNDAKGEFTHRATILTNDPKTPRLDLRITGTARAVLAALPAELTVRSGRGRESSAEMIIYSEVWDNFSLQATPANGVTHEFQPVDPAVLGELKARSAQRLRVTLPSRDKPGSYQEHLELTATPFAAGEEPRSLSVKINQTVASPVALHGDKFDRLSKELQLGILRPHEGACGRVVLVVRDERRELHVERIKTEPAFLKVTVNPMETAKGKPAVYAIDVEVPVDAPSSDYLSQKGTVTIETDHPEIPRVEFAVRFAVIGR